MTSSMGTPEAVVRRFCEAVSERDPEVLRALLTEDVVYHNVGMAPAVGRDRTVAEIEGHWKMFTRSYEFRILHLAVAGDVVLTERVDVLTGDAVAMSLPVMGTFEVVDGKIAHWRDYFDSALIAKFMAGEDVAELVP